MSDLGFVHRFVPGDTSTTLFLLHGTGGTEADLLPLGEALMPEAAMLSVRGKVLENGMPRFFRRFAEGVFDEEDVVFRTHELTEFLTAARAEYQITGKVVAVGYSNGANIAASMMLLHPGLLDGAILLRAMPPLTSPAPVSLAGTRVLMASGKRDPIASVEQTLQLRKLLETSGADVELHWHDGGHELGPDDVRAAQIWLAP